MRSFSIPVRRVISGRAVPGAAWTVEDVQQLRLLAQAGVASEIIAARLRRTLSGVRNKAAMHGISLKSGGV